MEVVEEQSVHLPDGQDARVEGEGPAGESPKAVIAAVLANIAIGIVKFIAAFISGSSAMISEGIHSIVDSGNGLLILFGMKRAERKPDLAHPFGYSMELYFWTLVVAVMIFALGGGLSIYEGIERLIEITPDTKLGDPTLNYIVIAISAIIEGLSLRVALREFNAARGKVKPLRFIRDAKDPSLFTVVLEDSAALTGLLFAFLGTLLGHITGNPVFDGIASVLIGLLLAFVAVILLRETKGLLIGEGLQAD
ncbi:MAG: cation diffusion facilitator family transporter, partial [Eggerthellaceae bacterium]|nr:cation diffusion facilitator family transporter [Eggerthellaceae bacterium]